MIEVEYDTQACCILRVMRGDFLKAEICLL